MKKEHIQCSNLVHLHSIINQLFRKATDLFNTRILFIRIWIRYICFTVLTDYEKHFDIYTQIQLKETIILFSAFGDVHLANEGVRFLCNRWKILPIHIPSFYLWRASVIIGCPLRVNNPIAVMQPFNLYEKGKMHILEWNDNYAFYENQFNPKSVIRTINTIWK